MNSAEPENPSKDLLREEADRIRFIAENTLDLICETTAEGIYTYLNATYRDVLGYAPEEMLAHHFAEWLHPEDRGAVEAAFALHIRELSAGRATFRYRHKDGHWRWLETLGKPYQRPGEELRAVFVSRDITEQKEAETVRLALDEERLKRSKLESLAVLAGGIAHEFNNLLTSILGNLSLAQMDAPIDSSLLENLTEAERACLRTRDKVAELSTFAIGGRPVKTPVSLERAIRDAAAMTTRLGDVRYEFDIEVGMEPVMADESQLRQAIYNLLTNAAQAMPGGGTVQVEARRTAPPKQLRGGRYIALRVSDQGIGIRKEHLHRIFEPYFTTKKGGHGLGLATAHSIVTNHDGALLVDSTEGKGSTFTIYLPAGEDQTPPPVEALPQGTQARILVMDDEESIRVLVARMLEMSGYQVETVKDGNEAIMLYMEALESGRAFDIVLLDLRVPRGMGGFEAFQAIRALDPGVQAIVSSGYSENPVMADFEKHGIAAVIPKPYSAQQLLGAVQKILVRRRKR
ncbi:MAG TPA: ATP-binding protein [Chthoniobacteraceae bacterium]|nr:ATP-binding protein [Chthoniobacteraceae bacterium]